MHHEHRYQHDQQPLDSKDLRSSCKGKKINIQRSRSRSNPLALFHDRDFLLEAAHQTTFCDDCTSSMPVDHNQAANGTQFTTSYPGVDESVTE